MIMKKLALDESMVCPFCHEEQDGVADDFVRRVPILYGNLQTILSEGAETEICGSCDSVYWMAYQEIEKKLLVGKFYQEIELAIKENQKQKIKV